jgi:mono/diheme cytochrome c family protein
MYSKIKIAGIVLISSILIYRCSAALLVPTAADAQKTGTPLNTLVQGREMYIGHCGSCHNLYLPEKLTASEWNREVNLMQRKAKINDDQKEVILKYLTAKSRN